MTERVWCRQDVKGLLECNGQLRRRASTGRVVIQRRFNISIVNSSKIAVTNCLWCICNVFTQIELYYIYKKFYLHVT
jgi:hypothetical protein